MTLRTWKVRAKEDWHGIFYIGWCYSPDGITGINVSFGKKILALTWKG